MTQPDIDTQIEEILYNVIAVNTVRDMSEFENDNAVKFAHKAIKTLLIQSIDDALANQATPTASGKQVAKPSEEA